MSRELFLELAAHGVRMPIGTHLVLHEHVDADQIVFDGERLAGVVIDTARRFRTPLAVPLMDLTLEKAAWLGVLGIAPADIAGFHFDAPPEVPVQLPLTPRMRAACAAIQQVVRQPGLVAMGMAIGPFSLMTKLVADPITPVFLAGRGLTPADEPEVALLEATLMAAERVVSLYVEAQVAAGARAIIICEPAANQVYFSPNQLAQSYDTFDRLVMAPNRRLAAQLAERDVDLVFHDCGELTDGMVDRFATLGAVMLSFGSSRELWNDAARVGKDTVLYGNLPTKRFYAPDLTEADVETLTLNLLNRMRCVGHPFILGSECDVLSVPGSEREILRKVDAFMACGCGGGAFASPA